MSCVRGRRQRVVAVVLLTLLLVVGVVETHAPTPASAANGDRVRTRAIPERIAADCSVDVTRRLTTWLQNKARPRTNVVFAEDGCYRVDGTLLLSERRHLTLDGNGATLKAFTDGERTRRHLSISGGNDIVVKNLTIRGAKPPESGYSSLRAFQHGFALAGVTDVHLDRVRAYDVWGDFVYVGSIGRDGPWSTGVRVTRSRFERSGRQGIAVVAGRDILIRKSKIAGAGRSLFDLEANTGSGGAINVRVIGNTTGSARNFWLANKGAGVQVRDIVFADNTMAEPTGGLVFVYGPLDGYRGPYTFERNTLVITGRVHDEGSRGAFFLSRAAGVRIADNVLTLPAGTGMPAVESRDTRDLVIEDNDFRNAGQELLETPRSSPTTAPVPTTAAR